MGTGLGRPRGPPLAEIGSGGEREEMPVKEAREIGDVALVHVEWLLLLTREI